MDRRLGHDNRAYQPSPPISECAGPSTNVQVRSRRGGPIPEYHAGTLIPPLPTSSQPKAPVLDRDRDHEAHRFTDEDKIFFIHFLKSYLLGQGCGARIPDREDLYLLLARQVSICGALFDGEDQFSCRPVTIDTSSQCGSVETPLERRARTSRQDIHRST